MKILSMEKIEYHFPYLLGQSEEHCVCITERTVVSTRRRGGPESIPEREGNRIDPTSSRPGKPHGPDGQWLLLLV